MARFERRSSDGTPDPNSRVQTLSIHNGEVDAQTRTQLEELGFDPDQFVGQMEAIEKAAEAGATQAESAPALPPKEDFTAGLAKLKRLHDTGELTDEEFTGAKARLLG